MELASAAGARAATMGLVFAGTRELVQKERRSSGRPGGVGRGRGGGCGSNKKWSGWKVFARDGARGGGCNEVFEFGDT